MPKFFFSLSNGRTTLLDRKGVELASRDLACKRALSAGNEIVDNLEPLVRVSDAAGKTVLTAPLDVGGTVDGSCTDEQRIFWIANHDHLTGLANRALFHTALGAALETARRTETKVALILFDLDFLKEANDTFGHAAGDALLRTVAQRLKSGIRATDTAARLGGDEFAIILTNIPSGTDTAFLVASLQKRLREPCAFENQFIMSSVSAGISLFPDHESDDVELLRSADIALYLAKAAGRGGLVMYAPEMRAERKSSADTIAAARSALAEGSIVPFYQPKVSLLSGAIVGFEALLRWRHPTDGIQPPSTIADALDHPELSIAIGRAMQTAVFADMRGWIRDEVPFCHVAINASPVELLRGGYAKRLLNRLSENGIPPSLVEVEITETAMMGRNSQAVATELAHLRAEGVGVALDDFGTGYGSLTHLLDFPISRLKIDRCFVRDVDSRENARLIVSVIVGLCDGLGLTLVAEGVETAEQARYLRSQGCDVVQGYLYAKPMPFSEVSTFLSEWSMSEAMEPQFGVAAAE